MTIVRNITVIVGMLAVLTASSATAQPSRPMHLPPLHTASGRSIDVRTLAASSPVIVLRFLGSFCSHCREQIVVLNDLADTLRALDVRVVAFSDDDVATCDRFRREERIDSTVITLCSDPESAASAALGTSIVERNGTLTELHAVVVVYRGDVWFEHYGITPLRDFRGMLAAIERRRRDRRP